MTCSHDIKIPEDRSPKHLKFQMWYLACCNPKSGISDHSSCANNSRWWC